MTTTVENKALLQLQQQQLQEAKRQDAFVGKYYAYLDTPFNFEQLVRSTIPEDMLCDDVTVTRGKPIESKAHVTVHVGLPANPEAVPQAKLAEFGAIQFKLGKLGFFHNSNVFEVDNKVHERDVVYISIDDVDGRIDKLRKLLEVEYKTPYPHPKRESHLTLAYIKYGQAEKAIALLTEALAKAATPLETGASSSLLQYNSLHFKQIKVDGAKPVAFPLVKQ